jgi:hypothetical protein
MALREGILQQIHRSLLTIRCAPAQRRSRTAPLLGPTDPAATKPCRKTPRAGSGRFPVHKSSPIPKLICHIHFSEQCHPRSGTPLVPGGDGHVAELPFPPHLQNQARRLRGSAQGRPQVGELPVRRPRSADRGALCPEAAPLPVSASSIRSPNMPRFMRTAPWHAMVIAGLQVWRELD